MYVQQLRACVEFFRLFYQRHGNVDARCADVSMIGRDQHSHIIDFHPQINYLHGTDDGRAVHTSLIDKVLSIICILVVVSIVASMTTVVSSLFKCKIST